MHYMDRSAKYDQIASTYDRRYEVNQYAGVHEALEEFAGLEPSLRTLEVGCGTGHWLNVLHGSGGQVAGIDSSAPMLARARVLVPGVGLVHGRAEHLPWPAHSFDRVFCINAFHHFTGKLAFLKEARRILRPGGRLLIVGLDPHAGTDRWYVYDYFPETLELDRERYPASALLRDWMTTSGFENCATREVEHMLVRIPAHKALAQGRLDKTATSQLSILTDAEYRRGVERIQTRIERAERKGQTAFLTADLHLYGTTGSVR